MVEVPEKELGFIPENREWPIMFKIVEIIHTRVRSTPDSSAASLESCVQREGCSMHLA